MLRARAAAGRMPGGIMHCYTGSWEAAKIYLDLGLYISLSGAVTFKNAPKLSEVAANVPGDRLLIETDCPYMAPGAAARASQRAVLPDAHAQPGGTAAGRIADQTARQLWQNACAALGLEP